MTVRFLLDENVDPIVQRAVLSLDPGIDIRRIGDSGMPPLGTLDPDLLIFCEMAEIILVTNNRTSMPGHIADHFAMSRHHWGILQIRIGTSIRQLADELYLIWMTTDATYWVNRYEWVPL